MKNELQEQDVTRLLERIKERETSYPPEMQQKRREAFLALGVLSLSQGAGLGEAVGGSAHAVTAPMTVGMKLTLGFLSTVIIALSTYLGVTLYENRDALRDLLRGGSPTSVLVSPPAIKTGSGTPNPFATGTPLQTATPTLTPSPIFSGNENGDTATATKPGWHYGQTKTPKPKNLK